MRRHIAIAVIVGVVLVGGAGVAVAGVSDGNYDPSRQGCSGDAADVERSDTTEPGCQNFTVNVNDGSGHEAVRAGLPQLKDGDHPDPTSASYAANPDGVDPSSGAHFYVGADDNLNNGEHDGSERIADGPSDGGAIVLNADPNSLGAWLSALSGGDQQYLLTHPLPLVDFGIGACTDGTCWSTQTQQRRAYDGGSTTAGDRDAANYGGYTWDPETCSSADPNEADCGPGGIGYWHDQSGDVYVEPGVQVYEDPNPAGSPIAYYPVPAAYAGTCGVVAGGGPVRAPASPATNDAGQVVVSTGC
ncbi:MAG: hypothetical protein QOI95_4176 [Acidimicrobiaceae bacterium]|jgi:hypothetical protein